MLSSLIVSRQFSMFILLYIYYVTVKYIVYATQNINTFTNYFFINSVNQPMFNIKISSKLSFSSTYNEIIPLFHWLYKELKLFKTITILVQNMNYKR